MTLHTRIIPKKIRKGGVMGVGGGGGEKDQNKRSSRRKKEGPKHIARGARGEKKRLE
jgi:hypothetical protein